MNPGAPPRHLYWILSGGYALLLAWSLWNHEPWRDELHYWMSARVSQDLQQLWENRRYDAHPPLWSFLLFFASRISRDVVAMKVTHFLVATCAASLFVFKAPFSPGFKLLHLLGYFTLFEYGTISRNYALGEVWLWLWCLAAAGRERRLWPLGGLLILMALSNVHIYLVGCAWMLCLGVERLWRQRSVSRDTGLCLVLVVLSLGLFLWVTRLPAGTSYPVGADASWSLPKFCRVLSCLAQAFVPVPLLQIQFHDSSIFHGYDLRWIASLSLLVWFLAHRCLGSRLAASAHLSGTLLLLLFAYLKMVGFSRHIGHHYLLWLACLWVDRQTPGFRPRQPWFPWAIVSVQALAGLVVFSLDLAFPFSTSPRVIDLLRRHGAQSLPVAGLSDFVVAPVSAWLDRPIYSLAHRRWGTFVVNDIPWETPPPPADSLQRLREIAGPGKEAILVSDNPLSLPEIAPAQVEELGWIPPGIVTSERYFVYRFRFP